MKFLYKMEKKYGKYAISDLSKKIVICFAIGYILSLLSPTVYSYLIFSPYHIFVEHQFWRIFTWIFTTPGSFDIFTLVMLFFYWSIGTSIERSIGKFCYNLYIFSGMIFATIGMLIVSAIKYFPIADVIKDMSADNLDKLSDVYFFYVGGATGSSMMTYYMTVAIFLGFALIYSDAMVMLYFVIPFKVKWLAYIDLIFMGYEFVKSNNLFIQVVIAAYFLSFLLMYLIMKKYDRGYARKNMGNSFSRMKRKKAYNRQSVDNDKVITMPSAITRHKCAICGRSERDDAELEFRFCSKCNGNYEYCSEHLYTHEHIK